MNTEKLKANPKTERHSLGRGATILIGSAAKVMGGHSSYVVHDNDGRVVRAPKPIGSSIVRRWAGVGVRFIEAAHRVAEKS